MPNAQHKEFNEIWFVLIFLITHFVCQYYL